MLLDKKLKSGYFSLVAMLKTKGYTSLEAFEREYVVVAGICEEYSAFENKVYTRAFFNAKRKESDYITEGLI